MTSYITISKGEYQSLIKEVRRGGEVCGEIADLRVVLQALVGRLDSRTDKVAIRILERAIASCEDVSRLRVELHALERRFREFDQEVTPVRPPSRADIQAAFENSIDFAQGKKKPGD